MRTRCEVVLRVCLCPAPPARPFYTRNIHAGIVFATLLCEQDDVAFKKKQAEEKKKLKEAAAGMQKKKK